MKVIKCEAHGSGNISTSDTLDWGIQVVESLAFDDLSTDLATNTEHGETPLDNDEPVGLLDGRLNGIDVERADRAEVNDLSLDTLFCKLLGGFQGVSNHLAVSNDGHIASFPLDLGLSDGKEEFVGHGFGGHGEGDTIKHLVFQENDWVRVPNCRL